jgi:dienelactone hydrolase
MTQTFFNDDAFNFKVQTMLGELRTGCGDAGEILSTVARITDGDDASWVTEWQAIGDRVAKVAKDAATKGHRVSARDAYLRASAYYAAVLEAVDGVEHAEAALKKAFTAHRACFDEHVSRLDVPATKVAIPYGSSTMPGYFFTTAADGKKRPTVIVNNGSDGSVTSMLPFALAACARGYNALIFDGPGQQSMLFEHGIPFRPDWEAVITPVVDFLAARADVDADRIALYGISQAGYWVPRAVAFEHRIAAAVADPGVVDVSTSWIEHLPKEMVKMLADSDRTTFDQWMSLGESSETPAQKQVLAWRGKPYGINDPYDLFKAVEGYALGDLTKQITTPLLVTDPEGEQFWPGQSEQLYAALPGPKALVKFTAAEGADRHCEPMARSLLEQRVFDWLDETLA